MRKGYFNVTLFLFTTTVFAQSVAPKPGASLKAQSNENFVHDSTYLPFGDTMPIINLRDVTVLSFRNSEEQMLYYKYKSRIQKVMPYVKIAKQLYQEIMDEKGNSKRRAYRHYRKDVEKDMRTRFEKELKDLTTGQGEMLFKLINRETGNNSYTIIREIKGPFTAWFYQTVGKRWGYNLKENYDPEKEKLIEMIIRELGPSYNI